MLQVINISQARATLSQLVKNIRETKQPVIIVQDSTPAVVVYPYQEKLKEQNSFLNKLLGIKGQSFSQKEFDTTRTEIEKRFQTE